MAVAPLRNVELVVDYALSEIPAEKIWMGIPNYGYDWTLPFRQGSRARSISNQEAVTLAVQNRAAIRFDQAAQSPWFRYVDGQGREHEVWFEDARSMPSWSWPAPAACTGWATGISCAPSLRTGPC